MSANIFGQIIGCPNTLLAHTIWITIIISRNFRTKIYYYCNLIYMRWKKRLKNIFKKILEKNAFGTDPGIIFMGWDDGLI